MVDKISTVIFRTVYARVLPNVIQFRQHLAMLLLYRPVLYSKLLIFDAFSGGPNRTADFSLTDRNSRVKRQCSVRVSL